MLTQMEPKNHSGIFLCSRAKTVYLQMNTKKINKFTFLKTFELQTLKDLRETFVL